MAEAKARKISDKHPDAMVIGCDQVLNFKGRTLAKCETRDEAATQMAELRGHTHSLLSAAVIYEAGKPVWRHVGQVRMTMREFSDDYLRAYLDRNWDRARHSVGVYMIEDEGVRLFQRIEGQYFDILGLPLVELVSYLMLRGVIDV